MNIVFDFKDRNFAPFLAGMISLPGDDLGEDVGGCLVELIQVIVFCRRFLLGRARFNKSFKRNLKIELTSTVAWFGRTTLAFPSLPIRASQICSNSGISSSYRTVKRGLSQRFIPFGSSYLNIRFSKSSGA